MVARSGRDTTTLCKLLDPFNSAKSRKKSTTAGRRRSGGISDPTVEVWTALPTRLQED